MQRIHLLFKNEDENNSSSNAQPKSILNKPLAYLIGLSSDDINALWDSFDIIKLKSLALSKKDWEELKKNNFFKSDTLSVLLVFSVNYLLSMNISEEAFEEIMRFLKFSSEHFLGKKLSRPRFTDLDDSPIFNSKYLKFIKVIDETLYEKIDSLLSNFKNTNSSIEINVSEKLICENLGISLNTFKIIYNLNVYNANLNKEYNPFNYRNLFEMLKHFLTKNSVSERDQQILFARIGYPDNEVMTLRELEILFDISRERIRQILSKIARKLVRHSNLQNDNFSILKRIINFHIRKSAGVIDFKLLGDHLKSIFSWNEHPGTLLLIIWLLFKYDFAYGSKKSLKKANIFVRKMHQIPRSVNISNMYLISKESKNCKNCRKIIQILDGKLAKDFSKIYYEIDFDDFSKQFKAICRNICNGNEIADSFLRYKILESKEFKISESKIYNLNAWRMKYGSLTEVVENFLKIFKKPLHFSEFISEIQKYTTSETLSNERKDIEHSIKAAMDRSKQLLLWDRGTYIHKDNVKIPYDLIGKISEWIKKKLSSNLPYVSVSGVFEHFKFECLQRNIPTETALYSCLRVYNDKNLIFPKYPKITLNHYQNTVFPLCSVIEDYIKTQGREVSYDEIKSYVIEELLFKEFQLQQAIGNLKRVLRTANNGFIHYNNLNLKFDYLNKLVKYLNKLLEENKHVSIERIYKDKIVTCKKIGIDSGRMLYSLLSNEIDDFDFSRYPIVRMKSNKNSKMWGIRNEIIEYIKNSGRYCSYQELKEEYVNKRGYEVKHIFQSIASEKILKYTCSSVVHIDNINWTLEKEKMLIAAAEKEFYRATNANHKYASIKDMLECINLPELDGELNWTITLLGELLEMTGKFKVFGTEKQYFIMIPNKFEIFELGDLILQILKERYLGVATLDELSIYLKQKHLIKKRIPKNVLGDTRVFVDPVSNIIKLVK